MGVGAVTRYRHRPYATAEDLANTYAAKLGRGERECWNSEQGDHTHPFIYWFVRHACGNWTPYDVTSEFGTDMSQPHPAYLPRRCKACSQPLGHFELWASLGWEI